MERTAYFRWDGAFWTDGRMGASFGRRRAFVGSWRRSMGRWCFSKREEDGREEVRRDEAKSTLGY